VSVLFGGEGVLTSECVTAMQPLHKLESQSTQQTPLKAKRQCGGIPVFDVEQNTSTMWQ
jgi:hypothetical protein